ncbi:hypothetical protein GCM10008957_53020 [Deinococcus ruber]|uniref:Uncharacterized protein n=1 Tax=Deinococcus ruber TaxID=1848197 RepID=A0A918FGU1_9DEIO|nr:hypothetical protein GCM10008957_53020 [Deinococcus ruber]
MSDTAGTRCGDAQNKFTREMEAEVRSLNAAQCRAQIEQLACRLDAAWTRSVHLASALATLRHPIDDG